MQNANLSKRLRVRWPLRVGALAVSAAMIAGVAGAAHADLATVSATADTTYGFDNTVNTVAYLGSTLYEGGIFANAVKNGKLTPRAGLAAIDATTGALLPWAPATDGAVNAIAVDEATNTIYIAGTFTHVNGSSRDGIAQLDATTGDLTPFKHFIGGTPRALAIAAGRLYLGGSITDVDGATVGNTAAFTLATGDVDPGFSATADMPVLAIAYESATGRLFLGGKFHNINGATKTNKLAAVDPATGAALASFKSGLSVQVKDITFGPNTVYAALGGSGGRAAAFNDSGTVLWTITTDGDTQAVAYMNGVLYVGGHFDNACVSPLVASIGGTCLDGSISRIKFLAVDGTTGALLSWAPQGNGVHGVLHWAVSPSLGKLAAGGQFTTVGGIYHKRFAQFSS